MIRFKLRELMSQKGFDEDRRITFDEISKSTGIHRTTLTKIANQKGYVAKTDMIEKLCRYFNCTLNDFMEIVD